MEEHCISEEDLQHFFAEDFFSMFQTHVERGISPLSFTSMEQDPLDLTIGPQMKSEIAEINAPTESGKKMSKSKFTVTLEDKMVNINTMLQEVQDLEVAYWRKINAVKECVDQTMRGRNKTAENVEEMYVQHFEEEKKNTEGIEKNNTDGIGLCEICGMLFTHHDQLNMHLQSNHKSNMSSEETVRHKLLSVKRHICGICNSRFQYKRALQRHVSIAHGNILKNTSEPPFLCNICMAVAFNDKDACFDHEHKHHMLRSLKRRMELKYFQCDKCEKSFVYESVFARHIKICGILF